jgi:hypothetical protein
MSSGLQGKVAAWFRIVYDLCLRAGTYRHASTLVRHGWGWDYGGKPIATVLFWSALTLVDRMVAVLLFVRPRMYALPEAHRKRMRATSLLQRQNQELKQRTRVVRVFPNE